MEAVFHRAARDAHTFILGGDIFDFRWRGKLAMDEAIDQSRRWLERLIENNTACRYYYLLGNHDSHPDFVERLQELSEQLPNFVWERHLLRIDKSIFLHGDIVDRRIRYGDTHHEILDEYRALKEGRADPKLVSHYMYEAAVLARLHRVVVTVGKRKELVMRRLARYLEAHELGPSGGIEQVYFGHTHRQMKDVPYAGLKFHNPGAAIRGLPFEMIDAQLPPPELSDGRAV
jgi:UDP-2,3-diacylglucosamine hydrolase